MQVILEYLAAHWMALSISAVVILVAAYAYLELRAVNRLGPKDTIGNGITIGRAKAFDNRSLALRIERLSAGLAALKVVNQSATENISVFQEQTSSESSRSLTLDVKSGPGTAGDDSSSRSKDGDKDSKSGSASASPTSSAKSDAKAATGLAASDILTDQLNLASQIVNLEMLYERSLSDRLINDRSRLQTVLGFQVSITPPAGFENCVAVAEAAVRVLNGGTPVSLVALIPQEKTYNAQSVSSSAQSIGGSAVASVLTIGLSSKGESRQLFIHRDSDTIAFERDSRSQPTLFNNDPVATVFGWEFRPVLGRSTVSAGTRQMLAVIAVPREEREDPDEVILEIKTRSYWRRYDRKKQTSRARWRLWPLKVDGSNRQDSETQELAVPNTAKIQQALVPKVTDIQWVNAGADRATVIVKGVNLFSGTKVVIGGTVHREESENLTLKSDQAFEFETKIASLATGDSVLSGRFGSSFKLEFPKDRRPVEAIYIDRAAIRPSRYTKAFRISIDVKGTDANGVAQDFTVASLQDLPEPILFVGTEPVPMPYDYSDINPSLPDPAGGGTGTGTGTGTGSGGNEPLGQAKYLRVEAWIPAKTLARSPSVAFRVPFCGPEYQASQPLSFSEPNVTRMGAEGQKSVFRISHPLGFGSSIIVELDRDYEEGSPELRKTSAIDYRFEVATDVVSQYQNLIVRIGTAEPYLLPIPGEDKPKPRPLIDVTARPPHLTKGDLGPVEWSGTALETITSATLHTNAPQGAAAPPPGVALQVSIPAQFVTYDAGKRIEVYFSEGSTETIGRAEVEFQTAAGDTLRMPLFITKAVTR
ncbi:MAG TPA: hypothetical protein VKC34_10075 [Blastocatellia bacterium]|nr:hypothetical protein [Blastocatellia bacterium]